MHKLPYPKPHFTASSPFELVHLDLWGLAPITSMNGFKYYVLFIDHFTRFTWLYLLQSKSKVFDKFIHFKNLIENQFSIKIKIFESDGGGEYTSNILSLTYLKMVSYINFMPIHSLTKRLSWKHKHLIKTTITFFVSSFHFNCLLVLCSSNINLLNQFTSHFCLEFSFPLAKIVLLST